MKNVFGDMIANSVVSIMNSDGHKRLHNKSGIKVSLASEEGESFDESSSDGDKIEIDGDLDTSTVDESSLEKMLESYMSTALRSSFGDDDKPLSDKYNTSDIDDATKNKMKEDCREFLSQCSECVGDKVERAGHDFWLTRNGHGAGFWDGDWNEDGDKLTEAAEGFGVFDLLENEDGTVGDGQSNSVTLDEGFEGDSSGSEDEVNFSEDSLKEAAIIFQRLLSTSEKLDHAGFSNSAKLALAAANEIFNKFNK